MSELDDLYQDLLLDHSRHPHNHRPMDGASHHAEGYNPLCGDQVTVYLQVDEGTITDVSFEGQACAICTASASMMTDRLKGASLEQAAEIFHCFHRLLTEEADANAEAAAMEELGSSAALAGVRRFPIRVKCATLPWHTMQAAVNKQDQPVTSE